MTDDARYRRPDGSRQDGRNPSGGSARGRGAQPRNSRDFQGGGRGGAGAPRRDQQGAGGRQQPGRDRSGGGGGRQQGQRPDAQRNRDEPRPREDKPKGDPGPELPADIDPKELDAGIRQELITLPRTLADHIAKHLVAVGRLLDEDPEHAYTHAAYARKKASRVGPVREAAGLAAYRLGRWQEALADLRAARRMSGRDNMAAIIADCERGIGRPERALDEVRQAKERQDRPVEETVELRIVASGARRDLGEFEAALVELSGPELNERRARPWAARLFYAYADAALAAGREEQAREYFAKASAVDAEGLTDADERLAELEGLQIVESDGDITWTDAEAPPVADEDGADRAP